MAAVLGEKERQDNGSLKETEGMHPALHSWRDQAPAAIVRWLAYVGGIFVLSMATARIFQSPAAINIIKPVHNSEWIEIERPFPAFALSIPEAAGVAERYVIRRHESGGGRKDILSLGEPDDASPYFEVEIYRPGSELSKFTDPQRRLFAQAIAAGATGTLNQEEPLASKFGAINVTAFELATPALRHCLGFLRDFDDPALQMSGRFCQGDAAIERSTLACALDRLTLLAAGNEPKVGALFARAELNRSFCGQRDPILAATPKYHLLWKALANRPQPRRIGR